MTPEVSRFNGICIGRATLEFGISPRQIGFRSELLLGYNESESFSLDFHFIVFWLTVTVLKKGWR